MSGAHQMSCWGARALWRGCLVWALGVLLALAAHATEPVVLDQRLRPGRDLVVDQVDENVMTVRVLEDRGVVERVAAQGGLFPFTQHLINRQRIRFTTGAVRPDGGFAATVALLQRRVSRRLLTGDEVPLPSQPDMDHLVFTASVDAQGKVQPVDLQGLEGRDELRGFARDFLARLLEQVAHIAPLRIEPGQAAQQRVDMQVPMPGLPPLTVHITTSHRLIAVEDGVAQIEMVYAMDFDAPQGPGRIDASGSGGGTLDYDVAAQRVRTMQTNTLMRITVGLPDGTLEVQANTRQTQRTDPAE